MTRLEWAIVLALAVLVALALIGLVERVMSWIQS